MYVQGITDDPEATSWIDARVSVIAQQQRDKDLGRRSSFDRFGRLLGSGARVRRIEEQFSRRRQGLVRPIRVEASFGTLHRR